MCYREKACRLELSLCGEHSSKEGGVMESQSHVQRMQMPLFHVETRNNSDDVEVRPSAGCSMDDEQ